MILLALAVAWLVGVGGAALGLAWLWPLLVLGGIGVCAGFAFARNRHLFLAAALCLVVALIGILRYEEARPPEAPGGIAAFNDDSKAVRLRGEVGAPPEERELSQRFPVRVSAYYDDAAWQETHGSVLITAPVFPRFQYGDRLELNVRLMSPPRLEGFDYREYLARRGIVSLGAFPEIERIGSGGGSAILRRLADVRRPFDDALARSLPEPEAALARGILLGQRASIPQGVTDDFNRGGISHLVAISGWNVTIVAGVAVSGLAWLTGRRQAIFLAMAIVILYAALVGGSPSVLRAMVMGEAMLGASLVGRPGNALTAVCFAGALLTAFDPLAIDDVAFQLSFAATLGIVVLEAPLRERLAPAFASFPIPAFLLETFTVTTAASLAVLPIIAATFGRISLISLPANLLTVPLFPLVIGASFVTAVVGAISTGLGQLVGEVMYLPLAYLVAVARVSSDLPAASIAISEIGSVEAASLYMALGALTFILLRRRPAKPEADPARRRLHWTVALAGVTAVAAAAVWWDALSTPSGRLTVTVLDVGQGDAILVETGEGRRILIDGGPSGSALMQALGRELPASARSFDLVVLTHGQDDHVSGLVTVLERYRVESVLEGALPGKSGAYRAWRDALEGAHVLVHGAGEGQWADLGAGVRLEVLAPAARLTGATDNLNDNSLVLRLVLREVSFLLTGDIEGPGEMALLASGGELRSTVLKVPHHGSDGSSLPPLLAAAAPAIAVISVGAENNHGHPSPSMLLRLAGIPTLRTDENGSVRFRTDGRRLWIDFDRGGYRMVDLD